MNFIGIILLTLSVDILLSNAQSSSSNQSTTSDNSGDTVSDDQEYKKRPIDRGLEPLYVMTSTFLNVVQPESKGCILEDERFKASIESGDLDRLLRDVQKSFHDDWRFWFRHYVDFTVCAAVGVVFIVLMPLVGLIFCCCRCCGKCGGNTETHTVTKGDECRRISCSALLLVVNTFIVAGIVCAFLTNEMIHQQTSRDRGGEAKESRDPAEISLLDTVISNLRTVQSYQSSTLLELNASVIRPIQGEIDRLNKELDNFPNKSMDRLTSVVNVRRLMDSAADLADSFHSIGQGLQKLQKYSGDLLESQRRLDRALNTSKEELLQVIPTRTDCTSCGILRSHVTNLKLGVDFSQVQNLTSKLASLQSFIDRDVQQKLNQGRAELSNFTARMQVQVQAQIEDNLAGIRNEVTQKGDDLLKVGRNMVGDVTNAINSIQFNDTIEYISDRIQPKADQYGGYRYSVCIALSCMLVIIATLVYLGLCFGLCGETAGLDAGCCNRGVGATLLMTGVGASFLFAWLLMIAVVLLFVTGGLGYTEACRPLVSDKNVGVVKVANQMLAVKLNKSDIQFSIDDILTRCRNNSGVYTALNLETAFNLSGVFDDAKEQIRTVIYHLNDRIKSNLDSVVVIDDSILLNLRRSEDFIAIGVNFTSFHIQLNQQIVTTNLSTLAAQMRTGVTVASGMTDAEKTRIVNKTDEMVANAQPIVDNMMATKQNLSAALTELEDRIGENGTIHLTAQIEDLIAALNNTRNDIRMNSTSIIKQFVSQFSQEMYDDVIVFTNGFLSKIRNDVGKCRPLYQVIKSTTHSACNNFLSPYNGFWFSVGWCLFFLISSIILSVNLADVYRRTEDHISSGKNYDESYDAYASVHHPDYFRLEDTPYSKSKYRRRADAEFSGHNNHMYEPDEGALASKAEISYPGARANLNGLTSDPGYANPSYSSPIYTHTPKDHLYYKQD